MIIKILFNNFNNKLGIHEKSGSRFFTPYQRLFWAIT